MKHLRLIPGLMLAALLLTTGCDTAMDDSAVADANADVALSLATAVSEDNSGVLDQINDVFQLAGTGDVEQSAKIGDEGTTIVRERQYDDATGYWSVSIERTHGDDTGPRYASFTKKYRYQFLTGEGFQKFYNTGGVLASTINFEILEASGVVVTPHLTAERGGVTGSWVATGTDTDTVTVNGTYARQGAHVITTENATRTLDYALNLEITDLVGPRGSRRDLSQKVSGMVSGHYEALATFERGDLYREREIDRNFTITIDNGELTIAIDGQEFDGDAETGSLNAVAL